MRPSAWLRRYWCGLCASGGTGTPPLHALSDILIGTCVRPIVERCGAAAICFRTKWARRFDRRRRECRRVVLRPKDESRSKGSTWSRPHNPLRRKHSTVIRRKHLDRSIWRRFQRALPSRPQCGAACSPSHLEAGPSCTVVERRKRSPISLVVRRTPVPPSSTYSTITGTLSADRAVPLK
jgi:hypothetical protein